MNTQDEAAGMIGGLHYINGDNEVLKTIVMMDIGTKKRVMLLRKRTVKS